MRNVGLYLKQWLSTQVILTLKGRAAMSGEIFGRDKWWEGGWMPLAFSWGEAREAAE